MHTTLHGRDIPCRQLKAPRPRLVTIAYAYFPVFWVLFVHTASIRTRY